MTSAVVGEQRGDFRLVRLQLVVGGPDGRALVRGVLEFEDGERQAVDEDDDVRAAGALVLDDGELVDHQPVVVRRVAEVDDSRLRPADAAVRPPVLHRDAIDEHAVQRLVARDDRGAVDQRQAAKGVHPRLRGQLRVEPRDGAAQPPFEHNLVIAKPFDGRPFWRDVRARGHGVSEAREPVERGLLDDGFGEGRRQGSSILDFVAATRSEPLGRILHEVYLIPPPI